MISPRVAARKKQTWRKKMENLKNGTFQNVVFSIVRFSIATGAFSVNYSQKCLVMDLYHEKDGSVT